MKPVVWLQLRFDQVALQEIWEYKLRRSMLSASVFLCLKSENGVASASAEGFVKIPIKGRYAFKASGDLLSGPLKVGFTKLVVNPSADQDRTQSWIGSEEKIVLRDSHSEASSEFEVMDDTFSPVLSALALLPSLSHSWLGKEFEYRSVFVAGKRPTAIRISPSISSDGPDVHLQIQATNTSHLPGVENFKWDDMPWEKSLRIEAMFNERNRELTSISASVPIIGQIRLDLDRHERS